MRITELSLYTQHLQEQCRFYTNILGLPLVKRTSETFTVQAGVTRLTFRQTDQETLYHFAFTIPSNKLASAKEWLASRAPLLTQDGRDEFSSGNWNSGSLYFCDADNHILEFIAHYDLRNETPKDFEAADLLHISEIGLACEDVSKLVKTLNTQFALEPYKNSSEERFAAVGDIFGLFICVKIGRNWFPTDTVAAVVSPVEVTITGVEGQSQQLVPYPYRVSVQSLHHISRQ